MWDYVLGKYRVNVRHAANELAWQVEDNNDVGLSIKRYIIREFDKQDVRTFGLCFAIKTQQESGMFGSVIIQRQFATIRNRVRPLDKFDILYTQDFNPNSRNYILYRNGVVKEHLDTYLISLCKYYYELQSQTEKISATAYQLQQNIIEKVMEKFVYQCSKCLTVYDEESGEEDNGIAAKTLFENLPQNYTCSLCEAPKNEFEKRKKSLLGLQSI